MALAAGCGGESNERSSVLLVSFDTTRADALGCYSGREGVTPVVDRLARDGVLFERAFTPVPLTLPAHSSLLTGRAPFEHGVRNNNTYRLPDTEVTLAEVLAEEGYDTAAFVGAYVLAEPYGLTQGFDHYDARFDADVRTATFAERPADEVTDAALTWLAARDADVPFFLWVHYYDPHYPHELPAGAAQRFDDLYLEELAFCDAQLGRLLDAVDRDDTLVVVTSDHGEGMGEHDESTHGYFLYQGTQHVPLVLSHPRLPAGERRDELASILDVPATVLGFLELAAPSGSGRDLFAAESSGERRLVLETHLPSFDFGLTPLRGLVEGTHKYIRGPRPELYDLATDPSETRNLAATEPERLREWDAWLDRELRGTDPGRARHTPDADSTRRVQGLGYAGGFEYEGELRSDWDPLELARWIDLRNAGVEHFFAGRRDASIDAMRRLLERSPDSYAGHLYLGLALAERGEFGEGLAHLERAIAQQPLGSADAYWNLAVCLHELERDAEILPVLLGALEVDEGHVPARQKVAELLLRAGRIAEARAHLLVLREAVPESAEGRWASKLLASMRPGEAAGRAGQ